MTKKVYIINGPNLNLLGTRQPEIYGNATLKDIEETCISISKTLNIDLEIFQSNHEGELIEIIQGARDKVQRNYNKSRCFQPYFSCDIGRAECL